MPDGRSPLPDSAHRLGGGAGMRRDRCCTADPYQARGQARDGRPAGRAGTRVPSGGSGSIRWPVRDAQAALIRLTWSVPAYGGRAAVIAKNGIFCRPRYLWRIRDEVQRSGTVAPGYERYGGSTGPSASASACRAAWFRLTTSCWARLSQVGAALVSQIQPASDLVSTG